MPKIVRFERQLHKFPDDWTDEQISEKLSSLPPRLAGSPAATTQAAAPADTGYLGTGANVLRGVGAGALSSIIKAADLAATVSGGNLIRRAFGLEPINLAERPEIKPLMQPPPGTAGQVGYGIEQAAEYLLPAGGITRLSQLGQAATAGLRGARALNIATRAGLEGLGAATVAGIQSGGDPIAMRNAALTGGALSAGTGILAAGVQPAAAMLAKSATKQYSRALDPGTKAARYLTERQVAPGLIERGVTATSLGNLEQKAAAQLGYYGQKIADAWANLPPGTKVVADDVITKLDDDILKHTVVTSAGARVPIAGGEAKRAIGQIQDIQNMLIDVAEPNAATGQLEIPIEKLRDLRDVWGNFAAEAGKYQGKTLGEASKAAIQGKAADRLRAILGQNQPDIAALNKEYNFWKNTETVAHEGAQREVGKSKGLVRRAAGYLGAAGGFASGGVLGGVIGKVALDKLEQAASSTAWNTVSAVTKDRIAKALASGNRGMAEFYIGKAAKAAATSAAASPATETKVPAVSLAQ